MQLKNSNIIYELNKTYLISCFKEQCQFIELCFFFIQQFENKTFFFANILSFIFAKNYLAPTSLVPLKILKLL